ncbi:hypothetical protein HII31_05869 [Pseudocercospora fuligena]|uniref:Uncharacterized protein n=1 Tax=Pseudocercospora fuligena TaxID=685502 RepID=A0A8H6RKQ8_9PEZI|nr:hypothetical protein HII31_05869 [Pseudocercospora fuligena]
MQHPSDRSHQKHSSVSQNKGVFGSKDNPKTDAYYKQYFEPDSGVIFALQNYGPEQMGMTKIPPVPRFRLPALRHWSDVVFLEWMARTENDLTARTGLQKVVRCEISTPSTIKIIQQILQDMKHDQNQPITYESRISVRRPTGKQSNDAFYALLGTQNGFGVAYLLSQHKLSLGLKFIGSIDIWYAEGYFYLMFNIQNDPRSKVARPADKSGSGKGPVPGGSGPRQKRDHESRSAPVGKGKSPAHLAPAPPHGLGSSSSVDTSSTDETESLESFKGRLTYNDAVAKGSKYLQLMKQQNKSKDKSCTEEEAKKQGWVDHSDADVRNPSGISTLLTAFAPQFNTPSSLVNSDWRHLSDGKGSWRKRFRPTGAGYQQIVNARAGVIFITNTHGPKEEGAKQSPPVKVLPDMQHLSDFSYMAWTEAAKASKRSRKTLQKVVRCSIDNKDTKHIIAQVTNEAQPPSLPYSKRMSFKAGSKQYLALLGTENGVGVAYLLTEHQDSLGWKVIESIEVFSDQGFAYLVFNIRDAMRKSDKTGAAGPSKALSRRAGRYNTRVNLATAKDLGEENVQKLKNAGMSANPSHASVNDLADNGYTLEESYSLRADRVTKASTHHDETSANSQLHKRWPLQWNTNIVAAEKLGERNALDLIDASTLKASPSRWMEVDDLCQSGFELTVSESCGTDRLPIASKALAKIVPASVHMPAPQMMYRVWSQETPERPSISAFHHTNLLLSTAQKLKVLGPSAQESLIAWHDVAYLSRLQAVGEEQMRSLKHIIKVDTDKPNALQIVAELLGNWTPDFATRRTYAECTKEFNVLLGIMPGQEVTEFLLTHRATLGMKKVSQVSVWYARKGLQLFPVFFWYELEDVQEGVLQLQYLRPPIADPSNSGPSRIGSANPPGWRDASGYRPQ